MSHPFKRRMAKAALVLAAGAAPVFAAAGTASAAELPQTDLSGLTNLDSSNAAETLDDAARSSTGMVGETGGDLVKSAVPAAGAAAGAVGKAALPAAQEMAGQTAGDAGTLLGATASSAGESGLPASAAPTDALSQTTDLLPLGSLPTGALPL